MTVGIDPRIGGENNADAYSIAANTWIAGLFLADRLIVQPVAISVVVGAKQSSP